MDLDNFFFKIGRLVLLNLLFDFLDYCSLENPCELPLLLFDFYGVEEIPISLQEDNFFIF